MLAATMLAVELLAVLAVAVRVSGWWCPPAGELLERAGVGLLIGLLAIVGVSQLAAACTVFSRWWVFALQLLLAAVVLVAVPRRPTPVRTSARTLIVSRADGWASTAVLLLLLLGVGVAASLALQNTTTDFDTLQYHLPNAAYWVRTGSLWHLPPVMAPETTNGYPSNGELLAAWLMLPSHGVGAALTEALPFGALAVIGTSLLARRLGGRPSVAALIALALMASPLFLPSSDSVLTDFAGAGGVILALAVLLRPDRQAPSTRWVVLAGLALGLSVGSKDTALGLIVVMVALVIVLFPGRRVHDVLLLLLTAALPCALWFVRDLIAVGNPVYPASLSVAGHTVLQGAQTPLVQMDTTMAHRLLAFDRPAIHTWLHGWHRWLGVVAAVCVVAVPAALIVAARRRDRRLAAVAGFGVAATAVYLVIPYTGSELGGGILIIAQLRYDLPALLIGAALAGAVVRPLIGGALGVISLAWSLLLDRGLGFPNLRPSARDVVIAVAVVVAVAVVGFIARRSRAGSVLPVLGLALVGLAASTAALPEGPSRAVDPISRGLDGVGIHTHGKGTVELVAVEDMAALLGPSLSYRITTLGQGPHGSQQVTDPRRIDAALRDTQATILAVGPGAGGMPAADPPSERWREATIIGVPVDGPITLYVRRG